MATNNDELKVHLSEVDKLWDADKFTECWELVVQTFNAALNSVKGEKDASASSSSSSQPLSLKSPLPRPDLAASKTGLDPQLLWRVGRSLHDVAILDEKNSKDKDMCQLLLGKGICYVREAKKHSKKEYECYKWEGILLGLYCDYVPTKEAIAFAFVIRDCFTKAIELNDTAPQPHLCLAKWSWKVCQIGWMERKVASLIFAEPPTSTYEECEKHLKASWERGKQFILTPLLYGDLCVELKRTAEAKKWYELCTKFDTKTSAFNRKYVEEAKKKLGKI